jgi:hypothetical protein
MVPKFGRQFTTMAVNDARGKKFIKMILPANTLNAVQSWCLE